MIPTVTDHEDMSHDSDPSSNNQFETMRYEPPVQPPMFQAYEPLPYDAYSTQLAALGQPYTPQYADRVLDEAVEELFMDIPDGNAEPLDEFVQDWVPADAGFAQTLENDAALGFMLEKLLEE